MSEVIVLMSVVKFVCHLTLNVSNCRKYFSGINKIPIFNKNIRVPAATLSISSCLYCMHIYIPLVLIEFKRQNMVWLWRDLSFSFLKRSSYVKLTEVSFTAMVLQFSAPPWASAPGKKSERPGLFSWMFPCTNVVKREDSPRVQKVIWKGDSPSSSGTHRCGSCTSPWDAEPSVGQLMAP